MTTSSKKDAQQRFWGLGKENSWKQIIDGEFQPYGPMVFDLGLHGGGREAGFLESLLKGMDYAAEHLTEPLTPQSYLSCHRVLCSHFQGPMNNTEMPASEAGQYRQGSRSTIRSLKTDFSDLAIKHYFFHELYDAALSNSTKVHPNEKNRIYLSRVTLWLNRFQRENPMRLRWVAEVENFISRSSNLSQTFQDRYANSTTWIGEWRVQWMHKIQDLNENMQRVAKALDIPPLVSFDYIKDQVHITHLITEAAEIEAIHKKLTQHYHRRMLNEGQNNPSARLEIIAEHFQLMEWLHPLKDGQTRLDLVTLSKLLTEEGLTPPILYKPHDCLTSTLPEWTAILNKAMERWKHVADSAAPAPAARAKL